MFTLFPLAIKWPFIKILSFSAPLTPHPGPMVPFSRPIHTYPHSFPSGCVPQRLGQTHFLPPRSPCCQSPGFVIHFPILISTPRHPDFANRQFLGPGNSSEEGIQTKQKGCRSLLNPTCAQSSLPDSPCFLCWGRGGNYLKCKRVTLPRSSYLLFIVTSNDFNFSVKKSLQLKMGNRLKVANYTRNRR
jgi:hypothetical protein